MAARHEALARDILEIPETLTWADNSYRKVHAQLIAQGWDPAEIGRDQVARVMRELGVKGVRHHHGHGGAAPAGVGAGDRVGRVAWRDRRSRPPQ